jgi:hypothetical protein
MSPEYLWGGGRVTGLRTVNLCLNLRRFRQRRCSIRRFPEVLRPQHKPEIPTKRQAYQEAHHTAAMAPTAPVRARSIPQCTWVYFATDSGEGFAATKRIAGEMGLLGRSHCNCFGQLLCARLDALHTVQYPYSNDASCSAPSQTAYVIDSMQGGHCYYDAFVLPGDFISQVETNGTGVIDGTTIVKAYSLARGGVPFANRRRVDQR